jgi:hypothetical protein
VTTPPDTRMTTERVVPAALRTVSVPARVALPVLVKSVVKDRVMEIPC